MPNQARISTSSTAHNRISVETSWRTRRLAAILVSLWFGGILVVALAAPAAFRSVDAVMTAPPEVVAKTMQQIGPASMREILHYQVSEANRQLFDLWGWVQLTLGAVIFLMLLFLSTSGRATLGVSLAMLLLAALMHFLLIPRISEIGREMRAAMKAAPADALRRFQFLHLGFTAFELGVVVLGTVLLVLLLRSRGGFTTVRRDGFRAEAG
jgi:hypothetical protein